MKIERSSYFGLGLVALACVVSAVAYPSLPDPMPIHWNLRGEADNFCAKPIGPFLLPLLMPLIWALGQMTRYAASPRVRAIIGNAALGVVATLHVVTVMLTLGHPVSLVRWVEITVGVLFLVVGNYMGKVERNWWVGLRTPWTLASDEVWLRSNRFGGRLMLIGGLVLIAGGVLGARPWLVLVVAGAVAIAPVVHSYLVFRRLRDDQSQPT